MACLFPLFPHGQPVPCGKCPDCLKRRTNSWVFRILQDEKTCDSIHWFLLTYDNDHLRFSDNGYPTLCKRDLQLFFKRLRRAMPIGSKPIKYFLAGEYGTENARPHYHVLVMNANAELFDRCWVDSDGSKLGNVGIDLRPITAQAISYTLGYMFKKRSYRKHDDRVPEFHLMSKDWVCLI